MRDGPVTAHLARWAGTAVTHLGLITSFLFALILEGVACLCWWMVCRPRDSTVTSPDLQSVAPVTILTSAGHKEPAQQMAELDSTVEELIGAVRAGRLKLTVKDVRNHCQCAQKKAAELKRLTEIRLHADTPSD